MGPHEEVSQQKIRAKVTIDGPRVTIEYEDGFTLRLCVEPDSIVLRRALGLDDEDS